MFFHLKNNTEALYCMYAMSWVHFSFLSRVSKLSQFHYSQHVGNQWSVYIHFNAKSGQLCQPKSEEHKLNSDIWRNIRLWLRMNNYLCCGIFVVILFVDVNHKHTITHEPQYGCRKLTLFWNRASFMVPDVTIMFTNLWTDLGFVCEE